MPCLAVHGKAFAGVHPGAMVFKLQGDNHANALALPGVAVRPVRPMREWSRYRPTTPAAGSTSAGRHWRTSPVGRWLNRHGLRAERELR